MRSNFTRKIIYGLLIVGILGGMIGYTQFLDAQKQRYDLGEAAIGQVDTGSFMLKLALLGGARGIAANVLWTRAEELKKEQDWDRMEATVELITKLQPHFLSVWTFQGWNLAYNVSVEWDAPEDKYDWIKQGITFLKDGVSKNETSPDLIWDTAWTYYHKLGFADEAVVLRRLFYDDTDEPFKTYKDRSGVPRKKDDNFQLGYGWFTNAVALVDEGQERLAGKGSIEQGLTEYVDRPLQHKGKPGDLHFRTMPAHAQTRYAVSLEKESIVGIPASFGEIAPLEWGNAHNEWLEFGKYEWPAFNNPKEMVRIDDVGHPERMAPLSENQRYWTDRWAHQTNYPYWLDRCAAEMEEQGVKARRLFYEGTKAYKAGRFVTEKDGNGVVHKGAAESFEEGLKLWDTVLKRHPDYRTDQLNMKDTGLILKRYMRVLKNIGRDLPADTPFQDKLRSIPADTPPDPFDAMEVIKTPIKEGKARTGK